MSPRQRKGASNRSAERNTKRCAVYVRVSSDENLGQAFNSLDAQLEACRAYILSQAGEGWTLVPTSYSDPGLSGGTLDRPGLQLLLADIDAGRIDIVVTYKVDRLTRSLMDFARIVERFDAQGTAFVSVTQAFSTTSSMGRLTLNMLLSFAEFERDIIGERIRDKVAASKAKGIFMGGTLALGYDLRDRELHVNEAEATLVRQLFERYLQLGSVPALQRELDAAGIRSKAWVASTGREMGGARFTLGALYHVLQNRLYRGQIAHRGEIHPGKHAAIVDERLFEAVQAKLAEARVQHHTRPTRAAKSMLTGMLHDGEGVPMSPTFSYGRQQRLYRYYASGSVLPGRNFTASSNAVQRRVSAPLIEERVLQALRKVTASDAGWADLGPLIERVELRAEALHILLHATKFIDQHDDRAAAIKRLSDTGPFAINDDGEMLRVIVAGRVVARGGRTSHHTSDGQDIAKPRGRDPQLIALLRDAHQHAKALNASPLDIAGHANVGAPPNIHVRRLLPVAFLAPDIQRAILEGHQPSGLRADALVGSELPLCWDDQRRALGFAARR